MAPGVVSLLFLQIYFPTESLWGIPQAWSLCTEVSFYLFLPLYGAALIVRRVRRTNQMRRELIGLGTLVAISFGFRWWALHIPITKTVNGRIVGTCYPHCLTQAPLSTLFSTWLPSNLDLFAMGMLLALLSVWLVEHGTEPAWLGSSLMPWLSWSAAAVAFWWVSHIGIPTSLIFHCLTRNRSLAPNPVRPVRGPPLDAGCVHPQDRSLIRRLLQTWPVASIGMISSESTCGTST